MTVDLLGAVSESEAVPACGLTMPRPLRWEVESDDPTQAFGALNLPLPAILSDSVRPPGQGSSSLQDFRWSHDPQVELPKLPAGPPVESDVPRLEVQPLAGLRRVECEQEIDIHFGGFIDG